MFNLKSSLPLLAFLLGILFFAGLAYSFTEPTSTPPADNVAAPLNVSSTGQSKSGGLILNTGGATYGLIVDKGNVGIGTQSPSQKLDVEGYIRGATGLCIGGDCRTSWPAGGVSGGGGFTNIQVFTSSGTFIVPAGVTKIMVEVYGAGGGGGGNTLISNGGGAGGSALKIMNVTPGSSFSVTVGKSGGLLGLGGCLKGGDSSFGGIVNASGGTGGSCITFAFGGTGGIGSGGDLNLRGGSGSMSSIANSVGAGGSNTRGGGGGYDESGNGGICGGGGAGSYYIISTESFSGGGKGGDGCVIVWY